jgi:hypothetical protein
MNASRSAKDSLKSDDSLNKALLDKHLDLWYNNPPQEELTLDEFEEYALRRLKVCIPIKNCYHLQKKINHAPPCLTNIGPSED